MNKKLVVISFLMYLIILIWIVFFKVNIVDWINASINLMKEYSIVERFKKGLNIINEYKVWKVKSYVLNILILIPFPGYLKLLCRYLNDFSLFLFGVFLTLTIELIQLFLPFCGFALEDILCNSIGVIVGILFIKIFKHEFKLCELDKLLIGNIILFLPICLFAIINTIINFEVYII